MKADDAIVLAADTVVAVGRRVLPKAETEAASARLLGAALRPLASRLHRRRRVQQTPQCRRCARRASSKRASRSKCSRAAEIDAYIASDEWRGKAGGYAAQGLAGRYITNDHRLLLRHRRPAAL